MNSSSSNHMCGHKEIFTELDEFVRSYIKFRDASTISIKEKCKIYIKLKDGSFNAISDVYYVPGLSHNLLSMRPLSENGYDIRIFNCVCTIRDSRRGLIEKVNMAPNRLFLLQITS